MSEPDNKQPDAPTRVPIREPGAGSPVVSSDADVADFLARIKTLPQPAAGGQGRLAFAMDATMSRQPTWDLALGLQSDMFDAVRDVGGLQVQLVYFRGAGECRSSRWVADAATLARLMRTVRCEGGYTQIGKVLGHVRHEAQTARVNALVYVGDAMEEEIDDLAGRAGELALLGVPVFLFQEGQEASATSAFREIARITRGAHCRFDRSSATELRALLKAVAVYAAGGRTALQRLAGSGMADNGGARRLIEGMRQA